MEGSGLRGEFTFPPQERVLFGRGALERLASQVDRLGRHRAFVITGTTIATKTGLLERVQQILGQRFAGMFYPISQHVPRGDVLTAAFQAREAKADILISLGGGSPVDGTKAVALCLSEGVVSEEQLESYRVRDPRGMGFAPQFRGQPVPHIALTTTLSAGEFTSGFGITDEARRVKEGYGAPPFVPRMVILDPELTVHTPPLAVGRNGNACHGPRGREALFPQTSTARRYPVYPGVTLPVSKPAPFDPGPAKFGGPSSLSTGCLDVDFRCGERSNGNQPCDRSSIGRAL